MLDKIRMTAAEISNIHHYPYFKLNFYIENQKLPSSDEEGKISLPVGSEIGEFEKFLKLLFESIPSSSI